MQHEITRAIPLLDSEGNLTEPGYAKRLLPVYRRADITPATPGWRTCSGPMTRPCPTPTGRTWRMRGPLQPLCWPNKKELRHKGMAL